MDWNMVGAIGETLGAVAVFVSLIYLASQIKSNTRQSRATMASNITVEQSRLLDSLLCVDGISTGQWLLFVNFKIDVVDSVVPQPKNYDQLKVQAHGNWFEIT